MSITQKPRKHVINIQVRVIPLSSLPSWQRIQYFPKIFLQVDQRTPKLLPLAMRQFPHHLSAESDLSMEAILLICPGQGMHLPCQESPPAKTWLPPMIRLSQAIHTGSQFPQNTPVVVRKVSTKEFRHCPCSLVSSNLRPSTESKTLSQPFLILMEHFLSGTLIVLSVHLTLVGLLRISLFIIYISIT